MITLIHGEDILASRKYYLDQKTDDSIFFDAEEIDLVNLNQMLHGSGLFQTTNRIFIDNLFTRKGQKNLTNIAEVIKGNENSEIFIWAGKDVGVRSLKDFPKFENKNFKIPQNIWNFLDSIKPNSTTNINNFHQALNGTDVEIIFAMIVRQFRLMLGLTSSSNKNAEEVKKLAPWQKGKLTKQASLFGESKLKEVYNKLYKIDKNQKTGKTNLTLTQNIDILLLQI